MELELLCDHVNGFKYKSKVSSLCSEWQGAVQYPTVSFRYMDVAGLARFQIDFTD